MENPRWWNIAVTVMTLTLIAVFLLADFSQWRMIGAISAVVVFAAGWFALGRAALNGSNRWASPALAMIIIVTLGVAVAFAPFAAIMQCVAYPLLWVTTPRTRRAIIANAILALSVGIGYWISTRNLVEVGLTVGLSLAFSIALGLWITRISELSEQRQQLLTELRDAQEQLAAAHRESGVASERERLAREIHDTIAQDLTGLVMLSQRAQRELPLNTAGPTLALIEESAMAALAETRALVAASAPVGLGGGIQDALARLAERFGRETGVAVTVEAVGIPPLDRDTEVVLLRIAQEGLANVRKHSAAGSAVIALSLTASGVQLEVRDNGRGFDASAPSDGFGLGGMRDRLALVNGELDVASSPSGTVLTATLPAVIA
ncbi:MAG: sensor histidine kinase [Rhodoglobus sp.]